MKNTALKTHLLPLTPQSLLNFLLNTILTNSSIVYILRFGLRLDPSPAQEKVNHNYSMSTLCSST